MPLNKIAFFAAALAAAFALASAAMFASGYCPPAGPWPTPPWCTTQNNNPAPIDAIANDIGNAIGVATNVTLDFEAALPATTEPVVLVVNGVKYNTTPLRSYYATASGIAVGKNEEFSYHYESGVKKTKSKTAKATGSMTISDGLSWEGASAASKPGFIKGHVVMDAGGFIIGATRDGSIDTTMGAMKNDGGEWMAYDYYWSYVDYTKPEIVDQTTLGLEERGDKPARPEDIGKMSRMAGSKGMEFFLITELEWNVLPSERDKYAGDWDAYFKFLNEKWEAGQKYDRQMGDLLYSDPLDPVANAYWDEWFSQFERFMLHSAKIAKDNNIGLLAIGKQLNGASHPQNEARWRKLIRNVRKAYDGKITQVYWNDETGPFLDECPWMDELDYITIYAWNTYSDEEEADIEATKAGMRESNKKQFAPLYAKFKKPIIMILPFQSRDHAAQQEWFEPMASAPAVKRNFMAQADLYEVFFNTTVDEPWLAGVFTWGYWIEPDFNPKYSFDKSSSVRSKPAALVVRRWFDGIKTN